MNADDDENKDIASEVGVQGFPTIKFFPKDGSGPVTYSSARSEEAFVEVSLRIFQRAKRRPGSDVCRTTSSS